MPKLKHNRTIAVKSAPLVRGQSIISHVKHRLKPLPVRSLAAKTVKVKPQQKRQRVRVVSPRQKPLNYRTSRRVPATKLRLQKPRAAARNRHTGPSPAEAINRIKGMAHGRILILIGNGPSHKEAELPELQKYPNLDLMSVNRPDDRVWPTPYWIFCDNSQYRRHKALWSSYGGTIINSSAIKSEKSNSVHIKSLHGKGFSLNLTKGMYIGRSSVYAALQVGIWMGFAHIYVFGCDMGAVGGKVYPWGANPDVTDKNRLRRFKYEAEHYGWMTKNISKELRCRMSFCSKHNKWPFIKAFECLDHNEAITIIAKRHGGGGGGGGDGG